MSLLAALVFLLWTGLCSTELLRQLRDPAALLPAALFLLGLGSWALPRAARACEGALERAPRVALAGLAVLLPSALTAWLQQGPVRGQTLSYDASVYVLQARALSHFSFGAPVREPRLAEGAKFLLEGVDGRLHGVFVPGFPLFLAPFVRAGSLLGAALATSLLLGFALWRLARVALSDRGAVTLALALAAPTYIRAVHTADALSHGFVAALWALAWSLALELREEPSRARAALLGALTGWVAATRLLDGAVLGFSVLLWLAPALWRRRRAWLAPALLGLACMAPFLLLVALSQRTATGSARKPVVVAYVERSDWPPTCVRLGLGRDIGCGVEHRVDRESFGPDGYTWDDALRLVRARTGEHSSELLGLAALVCAALALGARWPERRRLALTGSALLLSVAYGSFYFGNSPVHGARHLYAAAPLTLVAFAGALWDLGGRAKDPARARGALALAALGAVVGALPARWSAGLGYVRRLAEARLDVTGIIARAGLREAVVVVPEIHSHVLHWDPWRSDGVRVVLDDGAGLLDLRRFERARAWWWLDVRGSLRRLEGGLVSEGLSLQWERAWPSFTRPEGLGVAPVELEGCCRMGPGSVLFLFEVRDGARLQVPFALPREATLRLRLVGLVGEDYGDWSLAVDGEPALRWPGYAPRRRREQSAWSAPRTLSAGEHTAELRFEGAHPASRGRFGAFDALEGELATP